MRTNSRSLRLLFALLAVFAIVAAACGNDDDDDAVGNGNGNGDSDLRVGMVYDIGGRGDQSFNDAAARGLDQAADDFGVDTRDLEPSGTGEDREELLRLLADEGYDLIIGVGFAFEEHIAAVSEDFPDTTFAIVDSVVDAPNVASLTFAEHEGSFLVGAAAALTSESDHIGFIGGVENPLIQKFEAGYVAGAQAVNPDITIDVSYISQPPDFSGFNDPARAREIAASMYENGADVIYHAAGGSGNGLFEAASAAGEPGEVWAIGVDSDQYEIVGETLQPYLLTSMLKQVDNAVYQTIENFVAGEDVGGQTAFDLSTDGVGYSTSGGFIDDITDQLDEFRQQIVDGEITVPDAP